MRVLLVNKFLYPKGGSETYVFKLGKALETYGHEVQYFGMEHPENIVGNRVNSYVSQMNLRGSILENLSAPFKIIYSVEARKKIREVLEDFEPDVVHLNNIQFYLTPSIILEIHKFSCQKKRKIKIIYTAHDYQLVCPSHGLFDTNLQICEKCLNGNYTHCLKTKCVKNSRMKSMLGMLDAYWWKVSKAYSYVDKIVCCSHFLKSKLDCQNRFADKTVVIHNFVDSVEEKRVEKGNYILELGYLSKDKGTLTLLKAARRMPDVHFVFAGYGPAEKEIKEVKNAEFVGFKKGKDLADLIRRAAITVCPSEWYENCPFVVIESQMYGTPVLGARIGGIPELIEEGYTGELFEPGNSEDLENKLRKMIMTSGLLEQYSENCSRVPFETPDSYYRKLIKIYGDTNENI